MQVAALDQFKDWLIAVTWNAQEDLDSAATALSYDIQLALADESSGLSTEDEFRTTFSGCIHVAR